MSHLDSLQTSSLDVYPLSSSSSRQAMLVFTQLFSSCAGPHGKNHIVRNACGGHVTISSSCSRLLSSISFSRSELKLLVSAVTGHLQQYCDCGLFMTHICMQLTQSVLDMSIHHSVASSTFLSFVSIIVDYIKSDSCDVRVRADFSNINLLLSYVQSILTSKTLLNIQPQELKNLSLIVLNAFVQGIPSVPCHRYSNGVFLLGQEKMPIKETKCVDGLMIECPEHFSYENSDEWADVVKLKLFDNASVRVALITCSMSGDMDDIVNTTFEGTSQQFKDLEECVFGKMALFCETLEQQNVSILLCQKVIHPELKTLLKSKEIMFVDRLGSQPIPFIRDLTGCQPITSLQQNIEDQSQYQGNLTAVSHCVENKKTYLCLKNSNANVVTLVICSEWEERLSELKLCVSTCLQGLESLVKEPWLLMGGGCWQMHCSQILKEKVLSTLPALCKKLSCSELVLRRLLAAFRTCLHRWCFGLKSNMDHLSFDASSFHCWRVLKNIPSSLSDQKMKTCSCGFKSIPLDDLLDLDIVVIEHDSVLSKEGNNSFQENIKDNIDSNNVILDNLNACLEALHKGVLTAGLLLSVGQIICDRN